MAKPPLAETGCCPRFDPGPWDEKEIVWKNKLFLKARVFALFHIPLNMDSVMKRDMEIINAAKARPKRAVMLYDETSAFGADVYVAVGKPVAGAKLARISGRFLSKVFEGDYKGTGKLVKEMEGYVAGKAGRAMKRLLFFFTTCPACAKAYGKNYTVLLAEV